VIKKNKLFQLIMVTHRSQYDQGKSPERQSHALPSAALSQAPSPHFPFTGRWTGMGILAEVTTQSNPKGKRQLARDKILVLKYSEEARD